MGFSRQEYWSGLSSPPPGDLPNQGSYQGLPHCRRILYQLSHQRSLYIYLSIYLLYIYIVWDSQVTQWVESAYHCRSCWRHRFSPWVGKIPWRRKWQPTTVFLPGKSRGGLQSIGLQRVRHGWAAEHTHTHVYGSLLDSESSSLCFIVGPCCAAIHGIAKSRTQLSDWTELNLLFINLTSCCLSWW